MKFKKFYYLHIYTKINISPNNGLITHYIYNILP